MNAFRGIVDLQVDSIVSELRRQQSLRCQELVRHAEAEAKRLLRDSRRKLYQRGREAVQEERRRREKALQQARHRIRAAEGERTRQQYAELLEAAWPELIDTLRQRWADGASRESWCRKLFAEGRRAFGTTTPWTIEHPADWTAHDARLLGTLLADASAPDPDYRLDPDIAGGLRIRSATGSLDGTVEGLLADRRLVEGRLLAAWEMTARGDGDD